MGTKKITYNDKVAIVPPGVRENQVWDLDMNEIKRVVNDNADELIAMLGLLNLKEDSGNKQNTLSADPTNTKYPSVTAVLEALKAVNINVDSQPVYLKKTNLKGQLEEIEAEFGSVARSIKTNIKNLYQTGLARTDVDSSVISLINSTTIRITDVNKVLFVNTINPDVNTQALDDYLQDFGTLDFSINDTNTPVDLNERAIYFLGINANGDKVYRTVRAYDLDLCYLIRVAVANNNGVYSIITTDIPVMYFPDLAANPPSDRGRTVAANGKIEPSREASISFKFSSFSMTKEAVNYRNNKLDPNYLSIPDSIGGQAGKFILGLPNFESLSVNIVDSTVINPKKWYLADGTVGSPDLADTKYQVYRVLITVDGKIIIQTKASTNANPQPGFNAIFDNVEDATKGLKSTNFPDLLPSGDAMPVGVFYMRAGAASNGSTMNDTNDFFYDPILASTSSSTVGATTHDSLSGKNDNPGFLHVTNTEKASWNSKEPAISTGSNGSYFADDKTWKALTTSAVVEGSRLYYTEARVSANVDVAAAKAKMHDKLTIISGSGLSLNEQELSLLYASGTTNGALRVSDWINFNSKAPEIHTHTVSQITDFPTIPTVDQTIIDGSTNAVSGNAVFDGLGVVQKDIAYVDVNGNNTTGVLGNIRKAFLTIDAALDSLPASGGIVKIGLGSFNSPNPAKIKANTSFIGTKEPVVNSTVTISAPNTRPTISAPTALVNGTILTGEFSALDKSNIVVSNLGIDVGKTWVDTFNGGVPVGGLVIASITPTSPVKNIYVSNVTVLGYAPATAQHCMLFENIIDSKFNNLTTYYHVHGIALKGLNITMDGLNLHSHNNDGLIIKSDTYAPTRDVSVNNVVVSSLSGYEGGGIILEEGVNGSSLLERISLNNINLKYVKFGLNNVNKISNVNISNFNLYDSQTFGIKFDNNVDKINLSGVNIVKTTTDGIDVSLTGTEVVNIVNSSVSDATGTGYKLTTAGNALININNSNTLNTTASYAVIGTGVYGSSNFGTGTLTGYINFNNPFVRSNGRIFSTNDTSFGDLVNTNGTLDFNFSNSSQKGVIESYNFTTGLKKPLEIRSSSLLLTALEGAGNRLVVADTNGNLSTTNLYQRPYKVYTALLTQTGTNAPVATVLENTLGGTVTFERAGVGNYNAVSVGNLFTLDKTVVFNSSGQFVGTYNFYPANTSRVALNNVNVSGVVADNLMQKLSIEIRVYL